MLFDFKLVEFTYSKILTFETINPHVKKVEYAVRGELAIRAEEIKEVLAKNGPGKLGFDTVVACLTEYPDLLLPENRNHVNALFPSDAIERAQLLLKQIGSVGAYSHSQDPDNIFLTQGASMGVQSVLQLIIAHSNVGIMIPIPQYPLYSATLSLFDAKPVPYYLNEEENWSLNISQLTSSLATARDKGLDVRALVIINPGNPTGQCLTEQNMREIIDFCHQQHLVLLADEVYQTNVYQPAERPFRSFKKGMIGECGRRGGYYECTGIDKQVIDQLYKIASVGLCPNVPGQIMVDLMVRPPKPKAMEAAKKAGKQPDEFYCLAMLNATGVCVVPGSGFHQEEGTWHFRSTFLPPEELFDGLLSKENQLYSYLRMAQQSCAKPIYRYLAGRIGQHKDNLYLHPDKEKFVRLPIGGRETQGMASPEIQIPDSVYPPIPGENHRYYGNIHKKQVMLHSTANVRDFYDTSSLPRYFDNQNVMDMDIHDAAACGNIERVKDLLDPRGAGETTSSFLLANEVSSSGLTPLHYAASRGHTDIVQWLVTDAGAIIDLEDQTGENCHGESAYDVAAVAHKAYVCELLEKVEREWWRNKRRLLQSSKFLEITVNTQNQPYNVLAFHNTVPIILHENQRLSSTFSLSIRNPPKYSANNLLKTDCSPWTLQPEGKSTSKDDVHLPLEHSSSSISSKSSQSDWFWFDDWLVDLSYPRVDSQGWQYARKFEDPENLWSESLPLNSNTGVRRRRWVRIMKRRVDLDYLDRGESLVQKHQGNGKGTNSHDNPTAPNMLKPLSPTRSDAPITNHGTPSTASFETIEHPWNEDAYNVQESILDLTTPSTLSMSRTQTGVNMTNAQAHSLTSHSKYEWENDEDVSECRLVCDQCSTARVVMSPTQVVSGPSSSENVGQPSQPRRVCDDCYQAMGH
ncbi:9831_t:CDS:10 [Racocetra fulgida]|uniref:9831_t:CDS:1 n=1 Tax=Racocetra fulgida TaxID=60492 RepID=A0A9N8ZQH7_9GLOM|nr:9831_t:CDS:10 [Racocetra fulgida]